MKTERLMDIFSNGTQSKILPKNLNIPKYSSTMWVLMDVFLNLTICFPPYQFLPKNDSRITQTNEIIGIFYGKSEFPRGFCERTSTEEFLSAKIHQNLRIALRNSFKMDIEHWKFQVNEYNSN